MKYPKEYAQKAMDVIGDSYLPEENSSVNNVELLTLAAMAIHLVSTSLEEDMGGTNDDRFEMVKHLMTIPEAYDNKIKGN